jgi:NarL family two-component system response regulator LiaR
MAPTRILLVDDHDLVREAISMLISSAAGAELVGSVASGEEAVLAAQRLKPDVIIMDLGLPGLSGIDTTRSIIADLPKTRIIAFSARQTREHVQQAFEAGACGYVLKGSAGEELLTAVAAVVSGDKYVTPSVADLAA